MVGFVKPMAERIGYLLTLRRLFWRKRSRRLSMEGSYSEQNRKHQIKEENTG